MCVFSLFYTFYINVFFPLIQCRIMDLQIIMEFLAFRQEENFFNLIIQGNGSFLKKLKWNYISVEKLQRQHISLLFSIILMRKSFERKGSEGSWRKTWIETQKEHLLPASHGLTCCISGGAHSDCVLQAVNDKYGLGNTNAFSKSCR